MDKYNKWLACVKRVVNPSMRLFCFHYAGGSASFCNHWANYLPKAVEIVSIQLPGREERFQEPFITEMDALIDAVIAPMRRYLDVPFALFGHSMGASVCYEIARELQRRGVNEPRVLFAAGRQAPQFPEKEPPIHRLPDAAFSAAFIERHASQSLRALFVDPEVRELFVPQLRADITLVEKYRFDAAKPGKLTCPVIALDCHGGSGCIDENELLAWREHTTGELRIYRFPGDHFFIESAAPQVLAVVAAELAPFL